jgi:hypothetical protein
MTRMGWHYTPCDRGSGGGGAVVLLIAAALIIAAIARPVAHAADAVARVVVEVLEITGIVLASAAGLAALAGLAYGAARVYRWHARNQQTMSSHAPVILSAPESVTETRPAVTPRPAVARPEPSAIEAPKTAPTGHVIRDEFAERRRARRQP